MHLPIDFVSDIRSLMGEQRFSIFAEALDQVAPVSIRLNPLHANRPPDAFAESGLV